MVHRYETGCLDAQFSAGPVRHDMETTTIGNDHMITNATVVL